MRGARRSGTALITAGHEATPAAPLPAGAVRRPKGGGRRAEDGGRRRRQASVGDSQSCSHSPTRITNACTHARTHASTHALAHDALATRLWPAGERLWAGDRSPLFLPVSPQKKPIFIFPPTSCVAVLHCLTGPCTGAACMCMTRRTHCCLAAAVLGSAHAQACAAARAAGGGRRLAGRRGGVVQRTNGAVAC